MGQLLRLWGRAGGAGGAFLNNKTMSRTVCSNRNRLGSNVASVTNRHHRIRMNKRIANNANWSQLQLSYANIVCGSTNELSNVSPKVYRSSLKYGGVFYPTTFSGASEKLLLANETVTADISGIPGTLKNVDVEECLWVTLPLLFNTGTVAFQVGEIVTGASSGANGTVGAVTGTTATGSLALLNETGVWTNGEVLTGNLGGAAVVDLTTTQFMTTSMVTINWFREGSLSTNGDPAGGYLAAEPNNIVHATPNVITITGGTITAVSRATNGSGYTSGPLMIVTELGPDGIWYKKNIGFGNTSGGSLTSVTISSGTPPSGLAAWTSACQLRFVAGGSFGGDTATHCASKLTGIPDAPVSALVIMGDSKPAGYGSTDGNGSENHDFGYLERAVQNRCGLLNMSVPSQLASALANHAVVYDSSWAHYTTNVTHAKFDVGINDITTGASIASVRSSVRNIAADLRALNISTSHVKLFPATTSSDSFATEANQTVRTGSGSGGVLDTINQEYDNGATPSDWALTDPYALLVGDTAFKWRVPASSTNPPIAATTTDGLHLAGYGLVYIGKNATIQSTFNVLA